MELKLAHQAGFCFGVKRAIEIAEEAAQKYATPIFTLGPLIHNPQVVEKLRTKGVEVIEDWQSLAGGTLIIRSHGVAPEVLEATRAKGFELLDATCPFVKKAQLQAKKFTEQGYQTIVVGDKKHPEVVGIVGWAQGQAIVVENSSEAQELPLIPKVGVVAQTTQPQENLDAVIEILKQKGCQVEVFNTICHATRERQVAALELASASDLMLVVGGTNSANTQKLARLCQETGTPTYHIETAGEIKPFWFAGKNKVGITAGASTPDWIIEEVINKVKELDSETPEQQEKLESMEEILQMKEIKAGIIVTGIIAKVTEDEVFVDIGGKSEGIIPLRELTNYLESPKDTFKIGEAIEVFIVKVEDSEGRPLLSKLKADAFKAWDSIEEAFEQQKIVEGKVREVVKGGLLIDLGVRAFMPASLIERDYLKDLEQFVGQTLKAKIIEIDQKHKKVVLSRKAIMEEENASLRDKTWAELAEGQIRKGVVRRLTDFGAFVDLGGLDGLIHISQMAWYRVKDPAEVVRVGDEVEVFVLGIDPQTKKISLSLKQVQPSPWSQAAQNYPPGMLVTAKVVRIVPFGAFVELEPGIDGLVHISQLSDKRVTKPEEVVRVGDEVQVQVLELDEEKKKISLSIKAIKQEEMACEVRNYLDKQEDSTTTMAEAFAVKTEEAKEE